MSLATVFPPREPARTHARGGDRAALERRARHPRRRYQRRMPLRIEDYAIVGDMQTAALVGRDGSVDWLCWPRFDSDACFAALLGSPDNGRWRIAPKLEPRRVTRRYRPGTLVLETEHEVEGGRVRVVDFMPPRHDVPDLVRVVEGVEGRVAMELDLRLRMDYGARRPWLRQLDGGVAALAGPDAVLLHSPLSCAVAEDCAHRTFEVEAGQRIPFTLTWYPSHALAARADRRPRRDRAHGAVLGGLVGAAARIRDPGATTSCARS